VYGNVVPSLKEARMTTARALPIYSDDSVPTWDRALYAFLAEKERRSGSKRTVQSYSRMLQDFFGRVHTTPDLITSQEVFAWAHGVGRSGREPSAVTINARIGCASSFFRFAIRMEMLVVNPCDALERPKIHPSPPKGLSADQVRQLLAVIPDTQPGRRDRAIILTLALTGRRRSEVLQLKAGDISIDEGTPFYTYRSKGGKRGRRELPQPAFDAIQRILSDRDTTLEQLPADEGLWQITDSAFYGRFRRYLAAAGLPASGLHVLRHTAAKLRRDVGESIEAVSAFLDHSSLAVTTTYLRRLEGQRDSAWSGVAASLGVL
jgi:integrase/recombinase XerD